MRSSSAFVRRILFPEEPRWSAVTKVYFYRSITHSERDHAKQHQVLDLDPLCMDSCRRHRYGETFFHIGPPLWLVLESKICQLPLGCQNRHV